MLALLVLLQYLPHQGGLWLLGALGLVLQPAEQPVGEFHRQRFHAGMVTPVCQNGNTLCRGLPTSYYAKRVQHRLGSGRAGVLAWCA